MLDFRTETFLTVCKSMNFTQAAKALGLTQPAVSQHIRWLEERYGVPLFLREKKRLTLTAAGEILRCALSAMHNDEGALKKRMQESLSCRKSLTFGVTMTIGEYAVIPSLARFIQRHQDTDLHICYGNTRHLLSLLEEGAIDFAIVEGNISGEKYQTRILRTEEYIAVAAANHEFAKPIDSLKDLTGERLLTREIGSGTRDILDKALYLKNMAVTDFAQLIEVENIHTIVSLLQRDCGVAFLYKTAVEEEIKRGTLRRIPLSDFQLNHDFTFIWNRESIFAEEYLSLFSQLCDFL